MSDHAGAPSAGFGGGLVTGDAVVVELRLAKLPSRSLAFFIDLAVQIVLLVGVTFLLSSVAGSVDPTLGYVLFFVTVLGVFLGYPVALESLTRGRTVGKLALGLRVVRDDGGPERFRHALVRGLMGLVELYLFFGFIAIIASLTSAEGKRVGDYLAGTVVVRERAPSSGAVLPSVPPTLAAWAATLDLTRLPDGLALNARQFLGRAAQLSTAARQEHARTLAHDIAAVVTPGPPTGLPAEVYVQTVVAERRRRATSATAVAPGPAHPAPGPVVDPTPPPSAGLTPPG